MMKSWTLALMALVAVGAAALVANASPAHAATKIEWPDLVPKGEPIVDPLAKLNQDQRFDLEMVLWARSLSAAERELEPNRPGVEDAQKYEQNFAKAGIDINKLLTDYRELPTVPSTTQQLMARLRKLADDFHHCPCMALAS